MYIDNFIFLSIKGSSIFVGKSDVFQKNGPVLRFNHREIFIPLVMLFFDAARSNFHVGNFLMLVSQAFFGMLISGLHCTVVIGNFHYSVI